MTDQIVIVDYDDGWPGLFADEETRIRGALGQRALMIEHVGSTSVPGLAAKPVIDALLVVADSADESSYVPALESRGYTLKFRERDWFEHRLFNRPGAQINLHVFSAECEEIERMLRFRDWLRTNRADREQYAAAKRQLAERVWPSVDDYANAKTSIVGDILSRAR